MIQEDNLLPFSIMPLCIVFVFTRVCSEPYSCILLYSSTYTKGSLVYNPNLNTRTKGLKQAQIDVVQDVLEEGLNYLFRQLQSPIQQWRDSLLQ